jgi:hypothetical protein
MAKNTVHMLVSRSVSRVCVREVYQSFHEEDFDSAPAAPGVTLPEFKSAIDNLHGACHAFLFGQTLVLAVLVHACGSDDECADGPVGCRLDGCWSS